MFDYESPKEKAPTDYTGLIFAALLAPVFILFICLGKADMGFTVFLVLGMIMLAIKLHWKLRRYAWFWATIVFVLLIHVPFLFLVHWPQSNVPTIAYSLPLGLGDFLLISGAISLAQDVFAKNGSSDDEDA